MIGRTVGHYRILERLGGGGMGVVYKAEDTKLGRMVALKFLPGELTRDDIARKRFLVEARAAAKLDHPNICTVHEIAESEDGQTFIAMAYVEGDTLSTRIADGPLPLTEAVRITTGIVRGLGAAHAVGIVHRDIKPANVMLTPAGEVKIVDFGVAKLAGETITGADNMPGTLAYMAPEQIRGEEVGPATDLWASGVVLFEMLSGQRPFRSASHQALAHSILTADPPPVGGSLARESPHLATFMRRALAKDPASRFQSADEMIRAIEAMQEKRVLPARRQRQRLTPRTAGLAAVLALVTTAAAVWTWRANPPTDPTQTPAAIPEAVDLSGLDPTRVVVAEFDNFTGDPSFEPFSSLASSRSVEELVAIGIDAVPATLAEAATAGVGPSAGDREDLVATLARAARARLVVTGDLEADGTNLRAHARVVDAATRRVLWAIDPGVAPRSDPGKAVDAAALRVRDAVGHTLRAHDTSVHSRWLDYELRPPRYEAAVELRLARDSRNRSVPVVEGQCVHGRRAIELDPEFVAAYQIMSDCHVVRNEFREAEPYLDRAYAMRDRLSRTGQLNLDAWIAFTNGQHEKATIFQREAVRLAPTDVGARHQLGRYLIHANRPAEAVRVFEQGDWDALVRSEAPRWGLLHFFMFTSSLSSLGRHEQELEQSRLAGEIYPDEGLCREMEAKALASLGRLDELRALIDKTLAQNTQLVSAGRIMMHAAGSLHAAGYEDEEAEMWTRASAWFAGRPEAERAHHQSPALAATWAGDLTEAERLTRKALEEAGSPLDRVAALGQLGVVAAAGGDGDEAAAISARLAAIQEPYLFGNTYLQRARIAAVLGEREVAMQLLRDAIAEGLFFWNVPLGLSLKRDPAFAALSGDPAFEELIRPNG